MTDKIDHHTYLVDVMFPLWPEDMIVKFLVGLWQGSFNITSVASCMCSWSLQSRLTLCNRMDFNSPGSSVHGILQARILESAAVLSSRGSCLLSFHQSCTPVIIELLLPCVFFPFFKNLNTGHFILLESLIYFHCLSPWCASRFNCHLSEDIFVGLVPSASPLYSVLNPVKMLNTLPCSDLFSYLSHHQ